MKKKPGRKPASANVVKLDVITTRPRISPPSSLNDQERAVFNETVSSNPHLKAGDSLMIAAYAQTVVKVTKLARKTDAINIASWEKSARVMLAMATKMRITQQAATHHITAGRARDNARPLTPMQQFLQDNDD